MLDRYPKAARKARVRKKWHNRFGGGIKDTVLNMRVENIMGLPMAAEFSGGYFKVPVYEQKTTDKALFFGNVTE